jgi:formylglycine-generating enzyme required for sulfatase activity
MQIRRRLVTRQVADISPTFELQRRAVTRKDFAAATEKILSRRATLQHKHQMQKLRGNKSRGHERAAHPFLSSETFLSPLAVKKKHAPFDKPVRNL